MMRRKLFCIVLAMLLLLTACAEEAAVKKGKTRKAPETKSGRFEEITPTPNRDTPTQRRNRSPR